MAVTYTPTTNFGAKDSLPQNDPDKVIKGSEFTTEFTAIQTAFSLAAPNASPTFTGTVTIPTADINGGNIDGTVIGAATPAAGSFTTGQFGTSLNVTGTVTADGLTVDGDVVMNDASPRILMLESDTTNVNTGLLQNTGDFTINTFNDASAFVATRFGIDHATGDISFYEDTGTTPKFFWDASAESLGIGNSSPQAKLDVTGAGGGAGVAFRTTDSSLNETFFVLDGGRSGVRYTPFSIGIPRTTAVATNAVFQVEEAGYLTVLNSGNVGIGTSSPATLLHLQNSSATTGPILRLANNADTINAGATLGTIEFYTGDNSSGDAVASSIEAIQEVTSPALNSALLFKTGFNTERMRITSAGNVGIGTSSPSTALHVDGIVTVDRVINATTSADPWLKGINGSGTETSFVKQDGSAYFAGNVGIGTSSPATALDVAGTVAADGLRVDGTNVVIDVGVQSSETPALEIRGNNNTANGNILRFNDEDPTTGTGQTIGKIEFYSTDVSAVVANIFAAAADVSPDANIFFQTAEGTTLATRLKIANTGDATFYNNVTISGSLSKGSGSFKIDHPVKPDTHHLVHSFIEGPQADNIYRGKVDLVAGTAAVNIDTVAGMIEGTFVLLNREVQCFTSNETGWTAVRGKVDGNILTIEAQDPACTDTISWMVVGERQDPHMYDTEWTDENGKVIVEPLKETEGA